MSRVESSGKPIEPSPSTGHNDPHQPPPAEPMAVDVSHGDDPPAVRYDDETRISKQPPLPGPTSSGSSGRTQLNQALLGEQLEHFELLDYIGGGGMGAVYRALDTRLKRIVALKLLARDQATDPETVRRFRNEAESSARCDHENIARVFYLGEDRGLHFIALEYIEGLNIRDLLERRGPLPIADALSYTLQVAEALAHASSRDVVHRDIKPSNVIITPHGRAKLVDMGLARLQQIDPSSGDLTASGVTLGTFDYISPEQARDPRSADVRSDIYSLGCTLYYMVTGQPPYPQGTVLQKLLQHQGDEPPDPRQFNPDLPDDVARIIRKMMAKEPRRRYQSAPELVGDLTLVARQLGLRLPTAASGLWIQPSEGKLSAVERHLPWIVPVASLVFIVVALRLMSTPAEQSTAEAPSAGSPAAEPDQGRAGVVDPATLNDSPSPAESTAQATSDGVRSPGPARPAELQTAEASSEQNDDAFPDRSAEAVSPVQVSTVDANAGLNKPPRDPVVEETVEPTTSEATSLVPTPPDPFADADENSGTPTQTPDVRRTFPLELPAIVVVAPDGTTREDFPTLRAACAAAKDGDIIELRYNGSRNERPLELTGVDVTIRGGNGYHPVIVCRNSDFESPESTHSMVTIHGGRLTLVNVALELDLSRGVPADTWAMISARPAQSIRLDRCWLTIRNSAEDLSALHEQVAFFDLTAPAGGTTMVMSDEGLTPLPIGLELENTIVRGEAAVVRCRDLQPVSFSWQNGLAITTEPVFVASGGNIAPRHIEPQRIELRHVTVVTEADVFKFNNTRDAPYQLPVEINLSDNVFRLGDGAALIDEAGVDTVSDLRGRLRWRCERNFADSSLVFLKIRGMSAQGVPESLTLPSLTAFLRGQNDEIPPFPRVAWKRTPAADLPVHEQLPADYVIEDDPSARNPAASGASDGRDAGCVAGLLPDLPASSADEPDLFPAVRQGNSPTARGSELDE